MRYDKVSHTDDLTDPASRQDSRSGKEPEDTVTTEKEKQSPVEKDTHHESISDGTTSVVHHRFLCYSFGVHSP
jgi:hypothetical protein